MTATETTPLASNSRSSEESRWGRVLFGASFVALFLGAAFYGGTRFSSFLGDDDSLPQLGALPNIEGDDVAKERPRYVATQFLSFTINTLGGLEEHGECQGRPVDPTTGSCYLGNSDNITDDMLHRLDIVTSVLHRIKQDAFAESPDIDHSDDVLKIFMMPEFFWRGPNGAYSADLLSDPSSIAHQVADTLRDLIAEDFFNDFLFVFGTVVAVQTPDDARESWETDSATSLNYFNWAIVYKGGSTHQHHYGVTKKYISSADFLSRTTLPNPKEEQIDAYSAMDQALQQAFATRGTQLITNNVLVMDGLRIGLEICLDHRVGTLWNHVKTHHQPLVDVLLVTSAGMAIERGPNPVVPGGVVYLSDGEASSAACLRTDHHAFHPESVCRGAPGGLKHIPVGGPG